jgi:uncharacterized membrane protein
MASFPGVTTALEEMQAWYAKPGWLLSTLGLNFGLDLTDLQSIKRLLGNIQRTLSVVVTNLNKTYTDFQKTLQSEAVKAQTAAVAAPVAATDPFSQVADLTL